MALMRWSPWRDMMSLQNDMNRVFPGWAATDKEEMLATEWSPHVDIYEDEAGIKLHADVPGVSQNDLDVKVENGMLTLKGERKLEKEDKKENYHRIERMYGSFTRSFLLPDYADTEKVEAKFKDGVLEVAIPKKAEKQPKKIKVAIQ